MKILCEICGSNCDLYKINNRIVCKKCKVLVKAFITKQDLRDALDEYLPSQECFHPDDHPKIFQKICDKLGLE
jgi:hypothetical protein